MSLERYSRCTQAPVQITPAPPHLPAGTKAEIIELEKTKKELEAQVKASIGDLKGIRTPEFTAKWIDVKGSTFTVTKKDSRQLRITRNK